MGGGGGAQAQIQEAPPWEQPAPPPPQAQPSAPQPPRGLRPPREFPGLVKLFKERKQAVLAYHLERDVHLVRYDPPRLEFRPTDKAPRDLAQQLQKVLGEWTGDRWAVVVSSQAGAPTLHEATLTGAQANPLVQAVLTAFPNATIGVVRDLAGDTGPGATAPTDDPALADPDWDAGDPDDMLGDHDL